MPRRSSLSPERILDAAQNLYEREGVQALSARNLAQELGVSQMAVYRYFSGISEIKSALLDRYFALRGPRNWESGLPWAEWLVSAFTGFWETLIAHPDTLSLAVETAYVSEDAFAVLDGVLELLEEAGFDERGAALMFHTVLSYTIGAAGVRGVAAARIVDYLARAETNAGEDESVATKRPAETPMNEEELVAGLLQRFSAIPPGEHPSVRAHHDELSRFGTRDRFVEGLRMLIDGMAAQLLGAR